MFVFLYNKDDRPAPLSWALLLLVLADTGILIWSQWHSSASVLDAKFAFVPAHPSFMTALTAIFLHAGWLHLIGNMWFLWMFGRHVEAHFGGWLFLGLYLVCGLGGNAFYYALNQTS